jgi:predicted nucleic acid-binding protein
VSLYVDSSALLKRYVDESDSDAADALLRSDSSLLTARHTIVEVRRNLARILADRDAGEARSAFMRDAQALSLIELDAETCEVAATIAEVTGVRTLDALHLAAAQRAGGSAVPFGTFHVRQAQAARALGLNRPRSLSPATAPGSRPSRLDPLDRGDAPQGSIERDYDADARRLGIRREVGLGEVEDVDLVDLQRAQQRPRVKSPHRVVRQDRTHAIRDVRARQFVERLKDVHALRHDEVCQQQRVWLGLSQESCRASRLVRWITREVADDHVGVKEPGQCRARPRAACVCRTTSSHGVPRLPSGTGTDPANAIKSPARRTLIPSAWIRKTT